MKFGFVYPGNDPAEAAQYAVAAEEAGWDGFFVWETIWNTDPWVMLGAIAARTKRVRIGTLLTPLPVRLPWKLAAETATLDILSNGRLILSVGLGAPNSGFARYGYPEERRVRAARLDEGLVVLKGLWSGEPFSFTGAHYQVVAYSFLPPPLPVQMREGQPHVPIWMVGAWGSERSMRRVLEADGYLPNIIDPETGHRQPTAGEVREIRRWLDAHSPPGRHLDIIIEGETPSEDAGKQRDTIGPYAQAGADWWIEAQWGAEDPGAVFDRVLAGPPAAG